MSNQLDNSRELTRVTAELDSSACALNTLSRLLTHSVDWERKNRIDHEEFTYGLSGLLQALAKDLDTNSCRISELNDRLPGGES
ncbi:hypothetical protein [Aeromonas hydrophila]|jgi:hypothetical protein|uniref:hypothetical protein n=1 Tax=Aeromonas hydrophila TaxID=644 RepID=UPI002B45E70C|nr:hypothetical protein [Aeromonas hydrophila]